MSQDKINNIQITKQGFENLEKELDGLVNTKRPKLVERLANARGQGDLSENSDYQNAKEELDFLDGKISELEGVIHNAEVVSGKNNNGEIAVGAEVTLKIQDEEHVYYIVGEWEADPISKKISHSSPLGLALVGKKIGEKVEVEAPAGKVVYEILSIK
ncbi:transcription elongation factor GreA [Patescibacteria group bacterium]|nr:transcription elongation factor GreA [Patescibacteria group bacterium]MBU0776884.1 transcription elongation factor GreA [Patescibacteria group bacterium]MBU0846237.1 transcription elongation factor GreA [Patescibacteria group bacterium]MBU0922584.1 transcription elongation factor GreA [Patescibacteria group bacterium]MBU1066635.1 transcription elongation factor GreA [Patescibacteria group bacterium]